MKKRELWNPFSKKAEEGNVPNRELLAYSAALSGQNMAYGLVNQWLFYFCTNILYISPKKVGIFTGIVRIWDAVNDPIVGSIIDRRKFKRGNKLHPYLGKLPLLIGILTALMFIDFGFTETVATVFLMGIYIAWDLTYSFQDVALWGMMALISPHSRERSRVSQWVNIGIGAAYAVLSLVPLIIGARDKLGVSERMLFVVFGIIFGFGGELLSVLACKTKERVEFINPPKQQSFVEDLSVLWQNKILLFLLLAQLLDFIGGAVPQIYFFKYCVSVEIGGQILNGETVQFYYGILVSILSAVSMFFSVKLSDKLGGMRNVIILAQLLNICCRLAAYFIGFNTIPQMIGVICIISLSSVPSNMIGIAQRSLICDAIDYAEWKTGKRTEGITNSMQNLTNKLKDALKVMAAGFILDALHFDAELDTVGQAQPEIFYKAQWPLFMLLPALGSLLYLMAFLCIRYSKQQKELVEKELRERHEAELQELA